MSSYPYRTQIKVKINPINRLLGLLYWKLYVYEKRREKTIMTGVTKESLIITRINVIYMCLKSMHK